MGLPSEFMLTDVRCFAGEQRARLRPITLLVGENSTGKTTFLGCYSALDQLFDFHRILGSDPDFNREPFSMGSFRDIVRARRGPQGRIHEFGIGFCMDPSKRDHVGPYVAKFAFTEDGSQPTIANVRYEVEGSLFLELTPTEKGKWHVKTSSQFVELDTFISGWVSPILHSEVGDLLEEYKDKMEHSNLQHSFMFSSYFRENFMPTLPYLFPIAPLRSKPKRTYDPVQEITSPEGDHVPMLMMRLNRTNTRHWQPLHEKLSAFGRESGMFSDVQVRRHGKQMSDPFQLQVKARSGTPANIMDVGYGVSQSLPILVDIHSHRDSLFLLQQPEVHLHPRAQAELATVFAASVRENGNSFMIETHSDHIVDRMRILVRQGKIPAEHISILYFEPVKNAVQIHNVEVDSDGNLENVPPGYRDFFLRESDRLLGFEE